jgi:hypothetical protein
MSAAVSLPEAPKRAPRLQRIATDPRIRAEGILRDGRHALKAALPDAKAPLSRKLADAMELEVWRADIPPAAKSLFVVVLRQADNRTRVCYRHRRYVLREAGIKDRIGRAHVSAFEAIGVLTRLHYHRKSDALRKGTTEWREGCQFLRVEPTSVSALRQALEKFREFSPDSETPEHSGADHGDPLRHKNAAPPSVGVSLSVNDPTQSSQGFSQSHEEAEQEASPDAPAMKVSSPSLEPGPNLPPNAPIERESTEGTRATIDPPDEAPLPDTTSPRRRSAFGLVELFLAGATSGGLCQAMPFGALLTGLGHAIDVRLGPAAPVRAAFDLGGRWARYCGREPRSHFKAIDWLNEGAPETPRPRGFGPPKQPNPVDAPWLRRKPGDLE